MGRDDGVEVSRDTHRLALTGILVLLGGVLVLTMPRGTFTIDESSYIASIVGLQDGTLAVEASTNLAPSPELYGFDAAPRGRPLVAPVASSSPPLYAPIALPFSLLGVRGLMALQILSFLACAALVFTFVRRIAQRDDVAWLAFVTFVVGSFTLEYAQAIWPHALSMALVMGAFELASRVRAGASPWLAAGAGACVAIAAGLRYQNIVLVAAVALGLAFVPRPRLRAALLAFVIGAAPVILASSFMNHVRYDSWNPISKGGGYLEVARGRSQSADIVVEAFTSTWGRVVDYSVWPVSPDLTKDADTGAITLGKYTKKALLQSAPWAIVPLIAMMFALRRRSSSAVVDPTRTELLAMGVIVAGTLGTFAIFGFKRYDGWSFNQRYFLELVPLLACGVALVIARAALPLRHLLTGVMAGAALGFAVLFVDAQWRGFALMKIPFVLALGACAAWYLASRAKVSIAAFVAVLGISLGWAASMQLGDDLPGSRWIRLANAERLAHLEPYIPDEPTVLFTYGGNKDAYGPLLLDHDILIVDTWIDEGKTARAVIDSAFAAGRRVFILAPIPREILMPMVAHLRGSRVEGTPDLLEIRP